MKLIKIIIYFLVIVSFASCETTYHTTQPPTKAFKKKALNAREEPISRKFVVTSTYDTIVINKIKFKFRVFKESQCILDNEKSLKLSEIDVFQDDKAYYKRYGFEFALRIIKGRINVYWLATSMVSNFSMNSKSLSKIDIIYYMEDRKTGKFVRVNDKDTREFVNGYEPSMHYINLRAMKTGKKKRKNLIKAIEVYNAAHPL